MSRWYKIVNLTKQVVIEKDFDIKTLAEDYKDLFLNKEDNYLIVEEI